LRVSRGCIGADEPTDAAGDPEPDDDPDDDDDSGSGYGY